MATQIIIDPITRIEGHLRIECSVENGKVSDAWSTGTMWRGIETILKGKDPREAWLIAQRICGVCTTVHAIASVRAVENALKMEIPVNAQYIRNMIVGAHCLADNIIHFYVLSAVDWVDIASAALKADPRKAATIAQKLSPWKNNSYQEFKQTQDKLKALVESGQLGPFASGYWGHPAMHLDPDVNLVAAAHYFQALEHQRKINKVVTILGSKTPHIQNLAVGGVANPINLDSPSTLTMSASTISKPLWMKYATLWSRCTWWMWRLSAPCIPSGAPMARATAITSPCPKCPWMSGVCSSPCRAGTSRPVT